MKSLLQQWVFALAVALITLQAQAGKIDPNLPSISYVQYPSFDIVSPGQMLTVGGRLRMPASDGDGDDMAAVVILQVATAWIAVGHSMPDH